MKKFSIGLLFAFLLTFAFSVDSSAQVRFGVRAELGLNKAGFKAQNFEGSNLNNFKFGPVLSVSLPIIDLGVEGAILYSNNSLNISEISKNKKTEKITNHYIDVPVYVKKKFGIILPVKPFIAAGPYAKFKLNSNDVKTIQALKNKIESKSFEAGLNFSAGAEFFGKANLALNYRYKLTDSFGSSDTSIQELINSINKSKSVFTLVASFYF